jgi:hypothetical protein
MEIREVVATDRAVPVDFTNKPLPSIPASLQEFLADVINREQIGAAFAADPASCSACVKLPYPLGENIGFLLSELQLAWLREQREQVFSSMHGIAPQSALAHIDSWFAGLHSCPLPLLVARRIECLLAANSFSARVWVAATSEKGSSN